MSESTSIDVKPYIEMFSCDTARIIEAAGKLFLVIGNRRNTLDDAGQWFKNGERFDFDYIKETVIASGLTEPELKKSAATYKRLCSRKSSAY